MRVLFTGGSSFTGFWFIRELARAGHEVVTTFRKRPEEYSDPIRRRRVQLALEHCEGVFGCSFGDDAFLALARGRRWDLFCHHAAEVTNYKSEDFDLLGAVANNTRNVSAVLQALGAGGGDCRLLVTGSVFENDEGSGSDDLPAFSLYGLSKSFTYEVFRYYARRAGFALGKFVIPNPFGPYEDARFTAYLINRWFAGETAVVSAPLYVRDNIHVSLLARAYVKFSREFASGRLSALSHPSGYAESQGDFALRFAKEMRPRIGMPCEVELKPQSEFQEPRVRINTESVAIQMPDWDEQQAWEAIAEHYRLVLGST